MGEGDLKESKQLAQTLTSKPEYLLFLRRRTDGRCEPVSGQLDAAFSVRAVFHPCQLR